HLFPTIRLARGYRPLSMLCGPPGERCISIPPNPPLLAETRRTNGASRSEKLGRGGTDSGISETSYCHLIVIQRVQIPPVQSRADRSVVSLATPRATGGAKRRRQGSRP